MHYCFMWIKTYGSMNENLFQCGVESNAQFILFFNLSFCFFFHSVAFNNFLRSQGADMEPMESTSPIALQSNQIQNYDNSSIGSSSNQHKFIESQQQQQQQQQLRDDNSTDSSSFDDDTARKKHRRKLHFPFGKKTFQKNKHI